MPKKPSPYTDLPLPSPPKRGLFELVNEDARLIEEQADALVAAGLSWEEAIEKAVSIIDELTTDKALAYAGFIRELNAEAEAIKAMCERNAARAKGKAALADRLKKRLLDLLPADFKAENENVSLAFVGRGFKVDDSSVKDISVLPEDVLRIIPAVAESKALDKGAAENKLKLIASEVANLPEEEREKAWAEKTVDLQGLKLVKIISVSIR